MLNRGPDVVVALIFSKEQDGLYLVQYRDFDPDKNPGKHYHGSLEFPGGKVEEQDGTSDLRHEIALVREVEEEVGVKITLLRLLCCIDYKFPSGLWHNVHFYVVRSYEGTPEGCEGQRIGWVTLYQLMTYPKMLPLNRAAALILTTEQHPDILE